MSFKLKLLSSMINSFKEKYAKIPNAAKKNYVVLVLLIFKITVPPISIFCLLPN